MVFIFTYVYLNIFMIYLKLTCMSTLWALPNHSYVMGNLYRLKIFPSVLPLPLFHFSALVSFLARPKPKIPFLCLSLLRNQTETLATQANVELTGVPRNDPRNHCATHFGSSPLLIPKVANWMKDHFLIVTTTYVKNPWDTLGIAFLQCLDVIAKLHGCNIAERRGRRKEAKFSKVFQGFLF